MTPQPAPSTPTTAADEHSARIIDVRDHLGYSRGYAFECDCGANGVDIHPRYGQALREHMAHLTDIGIGPKEKTT